MSQSGSSGAVTVIVLQQPAQFKSNHLRACLCVPIVGLLLQVKMEEEMWKNFYEKIQQRSISQEDKTEHEIM